MAVTGLEPCMSCLLCPLHPVPTLPSALPFHPGSWCCVFSAPPHSMLTRSNPNSPSHSTPLPVTSWTVHGPDQQKDAWTPGPLTPVTRGQCFDEIFRCYASFRSREEESWHGGGESVWGWGVSAAGGEWGECRHGKGCSLDTFLLRRLESSSLDKPRQRS